MSLPVTKHTALETSDDIKAVLNWKLEELQSKNLPVEEGMADYIALGMTGFDERIAQLKEYKRMIDEEIKTTQERKAQPAAQRQETLSDYLKRHGVNAKRFCEANNIKTPEQAQALLADKGVLDEMIARFKGAAA